MKQDLRGQVYQFLTIINFAMLDNQKWQNTLDFSLLQNKSI